MKRKFKIFKRKLTTFKDYIKEFDMTAFSADVEWFLIKNNPLECFSFYRKRKSKREKENIISDIKHLRKSKQKRNRKEINL